MSIIEGFSWAQNRSKLERAINELKEQSKEVSEQNVYKVYTRLLGAVVGEVKFKKEVKAEKEAK